MNPRYPFGVYTISNRARSASYATSPCAWLSVRLGYNTALSPICQALILQFSRKNSLDNMIVVGHQIGTARMIPGWLLFFAALILDVLEHGCVLIIGSSVIGECDQQEYHIHDSDYENNLIG